MSEHGLGVVGILHADEAVAHGVVLAHERVDALSHKIEWSIYVVYPV